MLRGNIEFSSGATQPDSGTLRRVGCGPMHTMQGTGCSIAMALQSRYTLCGTWVHLSWLEQRVVESESMRGCVSPG